MPLRITDNSTNARTAAWINVNRQRIAAAQEQLSSGKRINRPSDDPAGADAVLRLRTTRDVLGQFSETAAAVKDRLTSSDAALENYQRILDRARALLTQGASDSTGAPGRANIAAELDGLRSQILNVADMRFGDEYVFGGTRQNAPPFDPATQALAAVPASPALAQLEPDAAPVAVGLPAETVFADAAGSIFQTLTDVATALRGTGDDVADRAAVLAGLDRLGAFGGLADTARTRVGASLNAADQAAARLEQNSLTYAASAERIEGADFVATALELKSSQQALDAALQASAYAGRRTLIDFLG